MSRPGSHRIERAMPPARRAWHASGPRPDRPLPLLAVLAALLPLSCNEPSPLGLTIATDLPPAECRNLAALARGNPAPDIRWIFLAPGTDPASYLEGPARADLLLLLSLPSAAHAETTLAWSPIRLSDLGLAILPDAFDARALTPPSTLEDLGRPTLEGLVALDDPRRDAATLAAFARWLDTGPWPDRYAALARIAAQVPPVGRGGTALARLARGEAAAAPALEATIPTGTPWTFYRLGPGPTAHAAVLPGSLRQPLAEQFLRNVAEARPDTDSAVPSTPLLAELLGATLVEAQPELAAARAEMRASGRGPIDDRYGRLVEEAPPWPPASVQKLRAEDPTGGLIDALAEHLAPGLPARYWLLQSWEAPPRPIDAETLRTLAAAAGGTLIAEPRFRAWLRGEWAAWARQRGRRVARQLAARPGAAP